MACSSVPPGQLPWASGPAVPVLTACLWFSTWGGPSLLSVAEAWALFRRCWVAEEVRSEAQGPRGK